MKRKAAREVDMFRDIYIDRPHVSQLSGLPLLPPGHYQFFWQFLHVLPKGSYPHYKLNPENILLGLPEEHAHQNQYEVFNKKFEELKRQYYKTYYGKEFDEDPISEDPGL